MIFMIFMTAARSRLVRCGDAIERCLDKIPFPQIRPCRCLQKPGCMNRLCESNRFSNELLGARHFLRKGAGSFPCDIGVFGVGNIFKYDMFLPSGLIGLFDCFFVVFSFRLLLCHSCRNGKLVSPLLESYMHVWCEWLWSTFQNHFPFKWLY